MASKKKTAIDAMMPETLYVRRILPKDGSLEYFSTDREPIDVIPSPGQTEIVGVYQLVRTAKFRLEAVEEK